MTETTSFEERHRQYQERSLNEPIEWPPDTDRVKVEKDWQHAGLRCVLLRSLSPHLGHVCGYVLVPASHPDADKPYSDVDVEVWWGLTFRCRDTSGGSWFGWDNAHVDTCYDPIGETERLAEQLAARATTHEDPQP